MSRISDALLKRAVVASIEERIEALHNGELEQRILFFENDGWDVLQEWIRQADDCKSGSILHSIIDMLIHLLISSVSDMLKEKPIVVIPLLETVLNKKDGKQWQGDHTRLLGTLLLTRWRLVLENRGGNISAGSLEVSQNCTIHDPVPVPTSISLQPKKRGRPKKMSVGTILILEEERKKQKEKEAPHSDSVPERMKMEHSTSDSEPSGTGLPCIFPKRVKLTDKDKGDKVTTSTAIRNLEETEKDSVSEQNGDTTVQMKWEREETIANTCSPVETTQRIMARVLPRPRENISPVVPPMVPQSRPQSTSNEHVPVAPSVSEESFSIAISPSQSTFMESVKLTPTQSPLSRGQEIVNTPPRPQQLTPPNPIESLLPLPSLPVIPSPPFVYPSSSPRRFQSQLSSPLDATPTITGITPATPPTTPPSEPSESVTTRTQASPLSGTIQTPPLPEFPIIQPPRRAPYQRFPRSYNRQPRRPRPRPQNQNTYFPRYTPPSHPPPQPPCNFRSPPPRHMMHGPSSALQNPFLNTNPRVLARIPPPSFDRQQQGQPQYNPFSYNFNSAQLPYTEYHNRYGYRRF